MDALLQKLHDRIEDYTEDLVGNAWDVAPEGRWNCSQIVEHLGRSYGSTAKMLESAIDSGQRPEMGKPTWKQKLGRILICQIGYFPAVARLRRWCSLPDCWVKLRGIGHSTAWSAWRPPLMPPSRPGDRDRLQRTFSWGL